MNVIIEASEPYHIYCSRQPALKVAGFKIQYIWEKHHPYVVNLFIGLLFVGLGTIM